MQTFNAVGKMMWGSVFNEVAFDYEIVPNDDTSGSIILTEIGLSFEYSDLEENTMVLTDSWGVFNGESESFRTEAGLFDVTEYINPYGGM